MSPLKKKNWKSYLCSINLLADYTFFEVVGKGNPELTINEMENHIREAQRVFSGIDVKDDQYDVNLLVQEVHIFKASTDKNYIFNDESKTAEEFLNSLSYFDLSGFCAGIAFTYRPFTGSTLGLAYEGDTNSQRLGGACQNCVNAEGRRRCYNCAVVTLSNAQSRLVSFRMSTLVLAHELGHLFGSPHDDAGDPDCTPSPGKGGLFVMFSRTSSGDLPNNNRLSECSKKSITSYIEEKGSCMVCQGNKCPYYWTNVEASGVSKSRPLKLNIVWFFAIGFSYFFKFFL